MKFLIGDSVIVTTGKDKGEVGVVGKIFTKTNKVWIDGVNKKIKHVKKKDGEAGSKVDFFAPIDASNIAYQDPKTKKAVKIGYTIEDGVKIRIIKKTQEKIVKNKITKKSRLIGLDLGSKRIGIAICDEYQSIATPFKTVQKDNFDKFLNELKLIIKDQLLISN